METKIEKEWIDTGLGFPIRLTNVPMIKVRGIWTPKINYNALTRLVLRALANKPARLTGNEIKFIRTHFELTLQEFGGRFCVTHVAVLKWEKTQDKATLMHWTTEKDIRLFLLSKLSPKEKEWMHLYQSLVVLPKGRSKPIDLDAEDLLAA